MHWNALALWSAVCACWVAAAPAVARAENELNGEAPPREAEVLDAAAVPEASAAPADVELPEITPGDALTLVDALRAAESRNLSLAVARVEIDKAAALLGFAWARNFPVLGGQMAYTHNDQADTFNPAASIAPLLSNMGFTLPPTEDLIVRPQNDLRGMLQLSVPVVNVEAWMGVSAAKLGVGVAELTVQNVRDQLLLAVAQVYWMAVVQRELVGIQESQVRAASDHLALSQARLDAGDAMRIDVVRAQTELEHARQDLLSAHLGLDNARDALGTLTGLNGLPLPADPPSLPVPALEGEAALTQAVAGRADVRAGNLGVDLADRMVDVSWMQFIPTLNAAAQASYLFTDPPDLGSSERGRWAFFVTLSLPLYNQMRYADLDAKRAALRQAEARAKDVQNQATLEVRRAQRDYLGALAQTETAERQAALTHEALALTESAYANGASTSLEVTDAQRTCRAADINAVAQRLRSQMALLALLRALGEDLVLAAQAG